MRILVSGGGVAGLSTGIDLVAEGHDVTLVERSNHLRVNGSPIDIRGASIGVAAKMGVLDSIRAHRITMSERIEFVDASDRVVAVLQPDEVNDTADDVEIPREDLVTILRAALPATTPLIFGESISELHDDGAGVDVRFSSGASDRYDLVVGADGMHSATRRLVFGQEHRFLRHLGFYTAIAALPASARKDGRNSMFNSPGLMAGITGYQDKALAVFLFRSPWIDYDYRDLDAQKKLLTDAFAGQREWRLDELLEAAVADPELYFDSVSQIDMDTWHRGRVVLVGDAAYCASPLSGRGTSLALTGAWFLAEALREHPDDVERAFAQYERLQRPHVLRAQATAGPGGDVLAPATRDAIDARNERLRTASR
ncbi:MAG: monooxygenase, FAD-binding protein [Mycobacterium sp.]|nr:monooxygenase, FAD-binding protein [Mycobacterium sp.]